MVDWRDMLERDVRVHTCATVKCCIVLSSRVSFITGKNRFYLPVARLSPHCVEQRLV